MNAACPDLRRQIGVWRTIACWCCAAMQGIGLGGGTSWVGRAVTYEYEQQTDAGFLREPAADRYVDRGVPRLGLMKAKVLGVAKEIRGLEFRKYRESHW